MEFLTDAIFSDETGELMGALLTKFDPEDYCSRAEVELYTVERLRQVINELRPRGFRFESKGVLVADTAVRTTLSSDVMSFVESECGNNHTREPDITDLVLFGVQYGGATILNPAAAMSGAEAPRLVPFVNYKVSESSLNIYGSCKTEDGSFRTHSLLEMENGGEKAIHCVFPKEADMSWAASFCKTAGELEIDGTKMTVYAVRSFLSTFYASVGEAFLNYLAFNVAYYNVGRKFIKAVSPAVKDVTTPSEKDTDTQRTRRVVERNVSIKHAYDVLCLDKLLECLGDPERLQNYVEMYPEANLTLHWLEKLTTSPWYTSDTNESTEEERMRTACAHLLMECKEQGLKYALELLTHRYYLSVLDFSQDTTPMLLKGGGVNGESFKRTHGREG